MYIRGFKIHRCKAAFADLGFLCEGCLTGNFKAEIAMGIQGVDSLR